MRRRLALLFGFFGCAWIIYSRSRAVLGPLVFGDELAYFEMIRGFAANRVLTTSQYGPLYPILTSFLYSADDVLRSYEYIRIFNSLIFSLSFFPLFLLARLQNIPFISSLFLAFLCVLLPWSTMSPFIWAEPLFYFLYSCAWYLAYSSLKTKSTSSFIFLGIVSSLLILTKQLAIAFFIGFILVHLVFGLTLQESRKKLLRDLVLFLLPHSLVVGFFVWNKLSNPGAGLMGYSVATSAIENTLFKLLLSFPLYQNVIYQINYVFLASFALPFLIFVFFCFSRKSIPYFQFQFNILITLVLLGISFLISLFYNTFENSYHIANEPTLTNGRYLGPLIPIILISAFSLAPTFRKMATWKIQIVLALLFLVSLGLFSPLASVYTLGIVNSPDTMFLSRWIGDRFPPWIAATSIEWASHSSWKVAGYIGLILIFLRYTILFKPLFLITLMYLSIRNSEINAANVRYLGESGEREHRAIQYLINNNVKLENLYYDKSIYVLEFNYQFWFGSDLAQTWFKSHTVENFSQVPVSGWLITKKNENWVLNKDAVFFDDYTLVQQTQLSDK